MSDLASAAPAEKLTKKQLKADHPTGSSLRRFRCSGFLFQRGSKTRHSPRKSSVLPESVFVPLSLFREYPRDPLHPRTALPLATGISLPPRPSRLCFWRRWRWLSIGGNHLNHAARKNVNLSYVVMDNFVYGLTKNQTLLPPRSGNDPKPTPGCD